MDVVVHLFQFCTISEIASHANVCLLWWRASQRRDCLGGLVDCNYTCCKEALRNYAQELSLRDFRILLSNAQVDAHEPCNGVDHQYPRFITWGSMGLSNSVLQSLEGHNMPSICQKDSIIPIVNLKRNICLRSRAGTGKTAAICIALLQKLDLNLSNQALIVVPTREIGIATKLMIDQFGTKCTVDLYILGATITSARETTPSNIVISTPGRILNHVHRGFISLHNLHTCVFDEFDDAMGKGMSQDVKEILSIIPSEARAVFLLSVLDSECQSLIDHHAPNTLYLTPKKNTISFRSANHHFVDVDIGDDKVSIVCDMLESFDIESGVLFCNSKEMVDALWSALDHRSLKLTLGERPNCIFFGTESTDSSGNRLVQIVIHVDLPENVGDYESRFENQIRPKSVISFVPSDQKNWIPRIRGFFDLKVTELPADFKFK